MPTAKIPISMGLTEAEYQDFLTVCAHFNLNKSATFRALVRNEIQRMEAVRENPAP